MASVRDTVAEREGARERGREGERDQLEHRGLSSSLLLRFDYPCRILSRLVRNCVCVRARVCARASVQRALSLAARYIRKYPPFTYACMRIHAYASEHVVRRMWQKRPIIEAKETYYSFEHVLRRMWQKRLTHMANENDSDKRVIGLFCLCNRSLLPM